MRHLTPLLNEENVTNFLQDLPKNLNIASNIIESLVDPEMNTIFEAGIPLHEILEGIELHKLIKSGDLTKSGISRDDVPRAFDGFKDAARAAVPHIRNLVKNFSKIVDLEEEFRQLDLRGDGTDLLASPQTAVIIAKTMCGKPLPSLSSEFQLLKAAKGLKKPKINEQELNSLSSHFCRKSYKQIMQMEGGPVIWSFLKPVFAGKILYTPDNHITREIISKMNGTVTFISKFKKGLEAWASTILSMQKFYNSSDRNARLQTIQLLVDVVEQHFSGVFEGLEANKLMVQLDNSGGLLGLIQFISDVTQCFELNRFVGLKDESDLETAAKEYTKSHELIAGLVFMNVDDENQDLPPKIEYKIRVDIDFVPTTKMLKERMWEPGARADFFRDLGYQRGFVQVQEMVDRAITLVHLNQTMLTVAPEVQLQQLPYLCYREDKFALYMRALTPVVATMAWIFLIAFMIRERVLERELHLEEMLRVMGLRPSVAWITWFSIGFTVMAFGSLCALSILKMAQLIPHSEFTILYLYFLAFCYSILMYW